MTIARKNIVDNETAGFIVVPIAVYSKRFPYWTYFWHGAGSKKNLGFAHTTPKRFLNISFRNYNFVGLIHVYTSVETRKTDFDCLSNEYTLSPSPHIKQTIYDSNWSNFITEKILYVENFK